MFLTEFVYKIGDNLQNYSFNFDLGYILVEIDGDPGDGYKQ